MAIQFIMTSDACYFRLNLQVVRSETARKNAEDANCQLKSQMVALQNSSRQQAFRLARQEVELRRMHAVLQRHFVDRGRIELSRSFQ